MMMRFFGALALIACASCTTENDAGDELSNAGTGDIEVFNIAANTAECVGVAPMRCLVVNGDLFYDDIEGYDHVEGESARICVFRTSRPEPIPADASAFEYTRTSCP